MQGSMGRKVHVYQVVLLAAVLGAWEGAVAAGWLGAFWVSSPVRIMVRTWELLLNGTLLIHTGVTLVEALSGLAAGTVAGILLGVVFGRNPTLTAILDPFIMAVNSLPRVALGPILIMYVGIGFASKFLLSFSLVVVIIMINTYEGIRSVDPVLVNALRILRANERAIFFKLLLPNSIPWIFAGLRVSFAFALVGALVGEFISARQGIGYLIDVASGAYDTTGMFVPLFTLMMIAVALNGLMLRTERHLLRWRPQQSREI